MQQNARISVVIPAINEAESIANVLRDIPDFVDQIIVADNGSTDDTGAIAEQNGAQVVHEPQRGYGAACLRGIEALDKPDIVVFLDGDYSDHPDQLPDLIAPILNDNIDMVIGSRALGNAEPGALTPQARYGNKLACLLIRLFWGVRYTDLGPFRAIRFSSLQKLQMADTDYGWTVEMQIKAALHKLKTCEVPVDYRKRIGRSKVSGTIRGVIGASYKILATIFLSALRYHLPSLRAKRGNDAPGNATLPSGTKRRLIIFTRYPEPGKTKTRLIPELGPQGAADLQRQLTEHALNAAQTLPYTEIDIQYTGATEAQMIDWLGDQHSYSEQHPGDLGQRMLHALTTAHEQGIDQAVIIGIDCPAITAAILESAFNSLHENQIALGPATDGGYYLIGATSKTPSEKLASLFAEIEWGTETVYPETLQILETQTLPWLRLPYLNDIDEPEDLAEWNRFQPDFTLPDLAIIIPTLNESENIEGTLVSIQTDANIQIIIADGGSTDDTIQIAEKLGARVITAPKGRAIQMNHAAAYAASDTLLFLHADTLLPETYLQDIRHTLNKPNTTAGAFKFNTNRKSFSMNIIAFATNLRAKYGQLPYGDQALFMTKKSFYQAQGYPDLPIMEDYILIRKLKKNGRIGITDTFITTNARRWHQNGPWRTTLVNQLIVLSYHLGIPPKKLADRYHQSRKE